MCAIPVSLLYRWVRKQICNTVTNWIMDACGSNESCFFRKKSRCLRRKREGKKNKYLKNAQHTLMLGICRIGLKIGMWRCSCLGRNKNIFSIQIKMPLLSPLIVQMGLSLSNLLYYTRTFTGHIAKVIPLLRSCHISSGWVNNFFVPFLPDLQTSEGRLMEESRANPRDEDRKWEGRDKDLIPSVLYWQQMWTSMQHEDCYTISQLISFKKSTSTSFHMSMKAVV